MADVNETIGFILSVRSPVVYTLYVRTNTYKPTNALSMENIHEHFYTFLAFRYKNMAAFWTTRSMML